VANSTSFAPDLVSQSGEPRLLHRIGRVAFPPKTTCVLTIMRADEY
jgi:hypothetical protein